MAHMIEGNKAFFVGQPAWHELGVVLSNAPTIPDAWRMAYPHSLVECPIDAVIVDAQGVRHTMPFPSHKAIIRSDGKHIGCVGKNYFLEQPCDVMNFAAPFVESGLATLEAGGSLYDGKRMWALLKIKESLREVIPGDAVETYLLVATSFDGSMNKIIKIVKTRVVCANTLQGTRNEKSAVSFKIRHTASLDERTNEAQAAILDCLKQQEKSIEAFRTLAHKQVTRQAQNDYVRTVLAPEKKIDDYSPQLTTKVNLVLDLIDSQRGLELVPAIRGTAWQAYSAVTEYVTHHASRTADRRVSNQWFDKDTIELNSRALETALAL